MELNTKIVMKRRFLSATDEPIRGKRVINLHCADSTVAWMRYGRLTDLAENGEERAAKKAARQANKMQDNINFEIIDD